MLILVRFDYDYQNKTKRNCLLVMGQYWHSMYFIVKALLSLGVCVIQLLVLSIISFLSILVFEPYKYFSNVLIITVP